SDQRDSSAANFLFYFENTTAKIFEDVATLKTHIKTHIPIYHCDKCDKKYSSKAALIVHQRIHTGELPYLCSHCGRGFRSSNMLQLHVRTHTGDRRYTCHICGKTSVQHLARHMRMHRGEKNYLCSECGKTFLSSGELRLHTRYHTGERPYTCKHCGKSFTAKCHLMSTVLPLMCKGSPQMQRFPQPGRRRHP
uniref:C2H2-type domain-containing protein n=1 Tax=Amphiprion percula TaxID=161767 RepID=A0A3P8TVM5_AMPPE